MYVDTRRRVHRADCRADRCGWWRVDETLATAIFGVAPLTAVGTDLWFAAITKLFAAPIHRRHGLIYWQVAKRLWLGSLPASAAMLFWLSRQPINEEAVAALKITIAAAVVIAALGLFFQKPLLALGRRFRIAEATRFKAMQGPLTVDAGALPGVFGDSYFCRGRGIGSGLSGVPTPIATHAAAVDCDGHCSRHSARIVCRDGALLDRQCKIWLTGALACRFDPGNDHRNDVIGAIASCMAAWDTGGSFTYDRYQIVLDRYLANCT